MTKTFVVSSYSWYEDKYKSFKIRSSSLYDLLKVAKLKSQEYGPTYSLYSICSNKKLVWIKTYGLVLNKQDVEKLFE